MDNEWHKDTPLWAALAMGRLERNIPLPNGHFGRVLITGGAGSVGYSLGKLLLEEELGSVNSTDLLPNDDVGQLDVLDEKLMLSMFSLYRPRVVFHLAGAKHAPEGERDPLGVCATNINGTMNVLKAAALVGARVVVASTCKSCDPETAYGASKLVAERMALNAGQVVVRYHNVVNSSGNVFEIWGNQEEGSVIKYTGCERYFISMKEAVRLTAWVAGRKTGRYILNPGEPRKMQDIADDLYPDRERALILPRRGDRVREPLMAASEWGQAIGNEGTIMQVYSPHDYKEEA